MRCCYQGLQRRRSCRGAAPPARRHPRAWTLSNSGTARRARDACGTHETPQAARSVMLRGRQGKLQRVSRQGLRMHRWCNEAGAHETCPGKHCGAGCGAGDGLSDSSSSNARFSICSVTSALLQPEKCNLRTRAPTQTKRSVLGVGTLHLLLCCRSMRAAPRERSKSATHHQQST